jgi:predicted amidohydrolase YtcJ
MDTNEATFRSPDEPDDTLSFSDHIGLAMTYVQDAARLDPDNGILEEVMALLEEVMSDAVAEEEDEESIQKTIQEMVEDGHVEVSDDGQYISLTDKGRAEASNLQKRIEEGGAS